MSTKAEIELKEKLSNKTAVIGVVGLGYVGLPLAVSFAKAGFRVIGFDVISEKVDSINRSESYIMDVDKNNLNSVVTNGYLQATTDQNRFTEVDAICICVPTPLTKTKDPDLSYIIRESETLSQYIHRGQLIILESTTYPGTTREVVLPILEKSGFKEGFDFYLAFSPERVDPGSKKYSIRNTPKVVGGIDPESTEMATILYRHVSDKIIPVSSPEVAEMTKIFENTFRIVNIALVNELTALCEKMKISVWEVIDTASTKPFGFMPFFPGPGTGGHCIPLDPYYLANKAREFDFHTRFIELAAETNEKMPNYVISRLMEALNLKTKSLKDAKIIMLGITYKRDVADIRESPSLKLLHLLKEKGADVCYNDPLIPRVQLDNDTLESQPLNENLIRSVDCVLIATDHTSYDYKMITKEAKFVFDTRGVTRNLHMNNVLLL
jgi:UDP-N-acetyl-D-glucosamine dehydrogenase